MLLINITSIFQKNQKNTKNKFIIHNNKSNNKFIIVLW